MHAGFGAIDDNEMAKTERDLYEITDAVKLACKALASFCRESRAIIHIENDSRFNARGLCGIVEEDVAVQRSSLSDRNTSRSRACWGEIAAA